jgi:hypothetical protein
MCYSLYVLECAHASQFFKIINVTSLSFLETIFEDISLINPFRVTLHFISAAFLIFTFFFNVSMEWL